MVELVDSVDLGSTANACRFESCCPHQKREPVRALFFGAAGLEPIQSAVLWTAGKRRLDGVYTIVYSSPVARQGSLFLVRQGLEPIQSAVLWTAGKRRLDGVYTIVYSRDSCPRQGSLFWCGRGSNPFNQQSCGLLSLSKKPRRVWRRKPTNKIKSFSVGART